MARARTEEPTAGPAAGRPIAVEWTAKYRPRSLADILGNRKAADTMRAWAEAWEQGVPERRALILEGRPGTGKTSAALALAADMGWDLIELNASDARSAPVIQRVAGQGARTTTFGADGTFRPHHEGGRTLIVLDEADNLYERGGAAASSGGEDLSDRGGKRAIIDTIRETRQPIILIVNDYYGLTKGSGTALRSLAETVKFQRIPARSVAKALADICRAEGVQAHPDALLLIAEGAGGDMRAAVNDLQKVAAGLAVLRPEDVKDGGSRDGTRTVFEVLPDVFKSMDPLVARRASLDTDESPESFILWIDENLPLEYKEPDDLARGFHMLSRADVFLGRVRRRQYYGFWSYAGELMTAGVAVAKKRPYRGWSRYAFPTWLRRMSASKAVRGVRDSLALKLGAHLHAGKREVRDVYLDPIGWMARRDDDLVVSLGATTGLSADEVAYLLETKAATKRVSALMEQIQALAALRPTESTAVWADDEEAEDEGDEDEGPAAADTTDDADSDGPDADGASDGTRTDAGEAGAKPRGQKGLFEFSSLFLV